MRDNENISVLHNWKVVILSLSLKGALGGPLWCIGCFQGLAAGDIKQLLRVREKLHLSPTSLKVAV